MPLYEISKNYEVSQLKRSSFELEKNLQSLFEENLESLMAVRFIDSEFTTGDRQRGRIDTLGLDEDGSPTIIEYKKTSQENVINQGLFYLDWLVDHQGDFTLAAREALGDDIEIDWSHPRLILIAESFSRYDEFAVNRIGANIELWEYRLYDQNMLYLDPMFVTQISRETEVQEETEERPTYTIEDHLEGKSDFVKELFSTLKEKILQLNEDGDITIKAVKKYVGFKHGKNFCEVQVQSQGLKLWLDIPFQELNDPYEITRDVSEIGHHGTGEVEVRVEEISDISLVMELIEQSYQQTV